MVGVPLQSYTIRPPARGALVLAAVQDPVSLERILRHVGLWADSEFSEGIEAIRGPPEDVWPAHFDPSADMAAVDEDQPWDWAA